MTQAPHARSNDSFLPEATPVVPFSSNSMHSFGQEAANCLCGFFVKGGMVQTIQHKAIKYPQKMTHKTKILQVTRYCAFVGHFHTAQQILHMLCRLRHRFWLLYLVVYCAFQLKQIFGVNAMIRHVAQLCPCAHFILCMSWPCSAVWPWDHASSRPTLLHISPTQPCRPQ